MQTENILFFKYFKTKKGIAFTDTRKSNSGKCFWMENQIFGSLAKLASSSSSVGT